MSAAIGLAIARLARLVMWAQVGVIAVYVGTWLYMRAIGDTNYPGGLVAALALGMLIAAGVGIVALVFGREADGRRSNAGWRCLAVAASSFIAARVFLVIGVL
jgi:hypothetical protein